MKKAKPTLKEEYDVVVAGAGLGGLTAAALLSMKGFSTLVVEKLPRIGGRFTNLPYKDFQLTTGALHLIPYQKGSVKRLFRNELQSDLEFIDTGSIPLMLEASPVQFVQGIPRVLDSMFTFSIGLKFREIPIRERIKFLIKMLMNDKPCMPEGGCKSIIQTLEKTVLDNKGEIAKQTSMNRILTKDYNVTGIALKRTNGPSKIVKTSFLISSIGPKNTCEILPENPLKERFKRQLDTISPTEGIKISFSSNKSILKEMTGEEIGLIFTPFCERIAGIVEPSSMDPNSAPPGKSLLMTYQKIFSPNIRREIHIGINDLRNIIPHFQKRCHILTIQVFKGDWPVNYARQGQDAPQKTPINGLYLVGDGAKPSGFIMADGVVESASRVVEQLRTRIK